MHRRDKNMQLKEFIWDWLICPLFQNIKPGIDYYSFLFVGICIIIKLSSVCSSLYIYSLVSTYSFTCSNKFKPCFTQTFWTSSSCFTTPTPSTFFNATTRTWTWTWTCLLATLPLWWRLIPTLLPPLSVEALLMITLTILWRWSQTKTQSYVNFRRKPCRFIHLKLHVPNHHHCLFLSLITVN